VILQIDVEKYPDHFFSLKQIEQIEALKHVGVTEIVLAIN